MTDLLTTLQGLQPPLVTVDGGGTWVYEATNVGNVIIGGLPVTPGSTLVGDNPTITFTTCGVYTFAYSLPASGACAATETILTLNVNQVVINEAGTTNCTFTITGEHPITTIDNNSSVYMRIDDFGFSGSIRVRVTNSCNPGVDAQNTIVNDFNNGFISRGTTITLSPSEAVATVQVWDSVTNTQTILDVSPTSPAASCTLPCGCVPMTPAEINALNRGADTTANHQLALSKMLKNALCLQMGAVENVDYLIQTLSVSSIGNVIVSFRCKHQPTTRWIGNKLGDFMTGTLGSSNGGANTSVSGSILYNQTFVSTCGTIRYAYQSNILASSIYNVLTTNFNQINLQIDNTTLIPSVTNNPTITCLSPVLEAEICTTAGLPACTSPTYAWTGPGGFTASTQSIIVQTAGTYTVSVTCAGLACTMTDSAVVV